MINTLTQMTEICDGVKCMICLNWNVKENKIYNTQVCPSTETTPVLDEFKLLGTGVGSAFAAGLLGLFGAGLKRPAGGLPSL
jgi:hypothetical protein